MEVYDGRKWPVVSVDVFETIFLLSEFVTRKRALRVHVMITIRVHLVLLLLNV